MTSTGLTSRERQIVAAVARGLSNRDIARETGIAQQTVKNHLSAIFQKLRLRSRVQLAVLALQTGLVEPRPDTAATAAPPVAPAEAHPGS